MWGIADWIFTEGEAGSTHGTFLTIYKNVRYQISEDCNTDGKLLCVMHKALTIEKLHIISNVYLFTHSYIYCLFNDAVSNS